MMKTVELLEAMELKAMRLNANAIYKLALLHPCTKANLVPATTRNQVSMQQQSLNTAQAVNHTATTARCCYVNHHSYIVSILQKL